MQKEFQAIIVNAETNPQFLFSRDNIKSIDKYLKVNYRISESVGQIYAHYLVQIFDVLIRVYSFYSTQISMKSADQSVIKLMRGVRRDILRLIQSYIQNAQNYDILSAHFMQSLQQLTDDYANSDPEARDPEVLLLFSVLIKHTGELMTDFLPCVLTNLC